jgi:hypothetical protein
VTFLASSSTNSSTLTDVEPGLLGFLVVAALAIALVFLLRSMNKQFRKIGPRPDEPESVAADEAADAETADAGATPETEAAPAEPDTGAGFVPDTGGRSGRGTSS